MKTGAAPMVTTVPTATPTRAVAAKKAVWYAAAAAAYDGEQARGARPAGYQAAQRAAAQRHKKKQKMAPACKGWPTGWPRSAALCASAPSPDTAPP